MPVSAERQRQLRAQKKQLKTKTCARCGKQFQPVRKDQKYCSAACRQPERIEPENKAKKLRALSKERLALAVEGQKIRQPTKLTRWESLPTTPCYVLSPLRLLGLELCRVRWRGLPRACGAVSGAR